MSNLFLLFVFDLRENCISILVIFYQNRTHQSSAINNSCDRQSNAFDRSVIRTPNAPPLSTLFFHFSISAIKQCWALNPYENHTDIEIESFQNMIVFDHINMFRIL